MPFFNREYSARTVSRHSRRLITICCPPRRLAESLVLPVRPCNCRTLNRPSSPGSPSQGSVSRPSPRVTSTASPTMAAAPTTRTTPSLWFTILSWTALSTTSTRRPMAMSCSITDHEKKKEKKKNIAWTHQLPFSVSVFSSSSDKVNSIVTNQFTPRQNEWRRTACEIIIKAQSDKSILA